MSGNSSGGWTLELGECVFCFSVDMYVHHDKCVTKCPEGYFVDETEGSGEVTEAKKCKECDPEGCPKGTHGSSVA